MRSTADSPDPRTTKKRHSGRIPTGYILRNTNLAHLSVPWSRGVPLLNTTLESDPKRTQTRQLHKLLRRNYCYELVIVAARSISHVRNIAIANKELICQRPAYKSLTTLPNIIRLKYRFRTGWAKKFGPVVISSKPRITIGALPYQTIDSNLFTWFFLFSLKRCGCAKSRINVMVYLESKTLLCIFSIFSDAIQTT